MRYQNKSFTVAVGSRAYADNWERTFGKKAKATGATKKAAKPPAARKSAKPSGRRS